MLLSETPPNATHIIVLAVIMHSLFMSRQLSLASHVC
jgi:hypothetical protein